MRKLLILWLALVVVLGACSPNPAQTSPPDLPTPPGPQTAKPDPTTRPTRPASARLTIWVPPQFDPNDGSPAGQLLSARLEEFMARRPGVRVEVRVKALSGPGGLLESLTAANAAAPLSLPDLALLPRGSLETAALKGLLYPYNGLSTAIEARDWYEYAHQLALLQNSAFGLPFAGDALVLLYRPGDTPVPPTTWDETLATGSIAFPAGDEQALFTLGQYLAFDATLMDDEGRPELDQEALQSVLEYYSKAEAAGALPFWLSQFTQDEQAWEAYRAKRAGMVVTWASRYLKDLPADTAAATIPTPEGRSFTLADGWAWTLTRPQAERHPQSVELAEFLTEPEFLGAYTEAAGYLPTRSTALDAWGSQSLRNLVRQIVPTARLIPPSDLLSAVSPALHQATLDILKEKIDPATAAKQAAERVNGP